MNYGDLFTKVIYTLFLIAFFAVSGFAQEICDDGIDNDGDGLTDCADPDCQNAVGCENTFSCVAALYQVLSGQLNKFDPATKTYTPIGPVNSAYNGTGYNIQDGYIYGQRTQEGIRYLYRVFNDGTMENLGEIINGTNFPDFKADFDHTGNLVTYQDGVLYFVDVDVFPLNYTSLNLTNLTGGNFPNANDIVYDYIHDRFYLLTSGMELWVIDDDAATIRMVSDLDQDITVSGGNGAAWADFLGNLYFFNNGSGNIYKVDLDESGENALSVELLVESTPNGNNDGMSCPLARIPEICENGIDDDGDGLVDCDDPDCTYSTTCGYTPPTGGEESGLESNSRLSEKIALRNYTRNKEGRINSVVNRPENRWSPTPISERTGSISDFLPQNAIEGAQAYVSSPTDLIGITNATEVFSVDYFEGGQRAATALAITAEGGIYEHTKYVCDRLHGAKLENIWNYEFLYNKPFIVTKYEHGDGTKEYSCSFGVFMNDEGEMMLESHWNLADYPEAEQAFTFQLWAGNMLYLQNMVLEVIQLLETDAPISEYMLGGTPKVYASQIRYQNHVMEMDIVNKAGASTVEIIMEELETEHSEAELRTETVSLTGAELQTVTINTEGTYAIGMTLSHNPNQVQDVVYFADGAWGLDVTEEGSNINDFAIIPEDTYITPEDGRLIERGIHVSGNVKDKVAVYRSMNAGFKPEDMNNFDMISFLASGTGSLEVTIVKAGISDWEQQMRTFVELTPEEQLFQLPMDVFGNNTGDWADVSMIVFGIYGNGEDFSAFELNLEDVQFTNGQSVSVQDVMVEEAAVFPNPMVDKAIISFNSNNGNDYTINVYSQTGQLVHELRGSAFTGTNRVEFINPGLAQGMYYFEIQVQGEEKKTGKLIIAGQE